MAQPPRKKHFKDLSPEEKSRIRSNIQKLEKEGVGEGEVERYLSERENLWRPGEQSVKGRLQEMKLIHKQGKEDDYVAKVASKAPPVPAIGKTREGAHVLPRMTITAPTSPSAASKAHRPMVGEEVREALPAAGRAAKAGLREALPDKMALATARGTIRIPTDLVGMAAKVAQAPKVADAAFRASDRLSGVFGKPETDVGLMAEIGASMVPLEALGLAAMPKAAQLKGVGAKVGEAARKRVRGKTHETALKMDGMFGQEKVAMDRLHGEALVTEELAQKAATLPVPPARLEKGKELKLLPAKSSERLHGPAIPLPGSTPRPSDLLTAPEIAAAAEAERRAQRTQSLFPSVDAPPPPSGPIEVVSGMKPRSVEDFAKATRGSPRLRRFSNLIPKGEAERLQGIRLHSRDGTIDPGLMIDMATSGAGALVGGQDEKGGFDPFEAVLGAAGAGIMLRSARLSAMGELVVKGRKVPASAREIQNVLDTLKDPTTGQYKPGGGFTVNLVDGTTPTKGFAVGVGGQHGLLKGNDATPLKIRNMLGKMAGLEGKDLHVGGWVDDDGVLYIEPSQWVAKRSQAVRQGLIAGEKAVYDFSEGKSIDLEGIRARGLTGRESMAGVTHEVLEKPLVPGPGDGLIKQSYSPLSIPSIDRGLREAEQVVPQVRNVEDWERLYTSPSTAGKADVIPPAPLGLMEEMAQPEIAAQKLRALRPEQIQGAIQGLAESKELRRTLQEAMASGRPELAEDAVASLVAWGVMSIRASPFAHEAGWMNILDPVRRAMKGEITVAELEKAIDSAMPAGSGIAGASVKSNANLVARNTVPSLLIKGEDGKTLLSKITEMVVSDMPSKEVRRRVMELTSENPIGVDAKVLSFLLLMSGRDDLLVLDRVQTRNFWRSESRWGESNPYDNLGMAGLMGGPRGVMLHEALERTIAPQVGEIMSRAGLPPELASNGGYHWLTWVGEGSQDVSHASAEAIRRIAVGDTDVLRGLRTKEGKFNTFGSGGEWGRDVLPTGPGYVYTTSTGGVYAIPPEGHAVFTEALQSEIKKLQKGYKVSSATKAPWFEGRGDFVAARDAVIAKYGTALEGAVQDQKGLEGLAGGMEGVKNAQLMELEHYSSVPGLTTLKGKKQGTGPLRGRERQRSDRPPMVHFYEKGTPPEQGLGSHRYKTEVDPDKIYNISKDPLGLVPASTGDATALEKAIKKSGFRGYRSDAYPIVKMFDDVPVRPGMADPRALMQVGATVGGGLVGAAMNEDPVQGALLGAGAGLGVGSAAGKILRPSSKVGKHQALSDMAKTVAWGENPSATGSGLVRKVAHAVDAWHPFDNLGRQAHKLGVRPADNPMFVKDRVISSHARVHDTLAGRGLVDVETGQVLGPSLKAVFSPLGDSVHDIQSAMSYLKARREGHRLSAMGLPAVGGDASHASTVLAAGQVSDPVLEEFALRWEAYTDALGQYAVNSGLWTPQQWQGMKDSDAIYVQFRRMIDTIKDGANAGKAPRSGLSVSSGVKSFKGDSRSVGDMVDAMADYTDAVIKRADRYALTRSLRDAVEEMTRAGHLEAGAVMSPITGSGSKAHAMSAYQARTALQQAGVGPDQIEDLVDLYVPFISKDNPVIVLNGPTGQKQYWQLNSPELLATLSALTPNKDIGVVTRFLLKPLKHLTTAAKTGLNPGFIFGTNPPRDMVDAWGKSRDGATFAQIGKGWFDSIVGSGALAPATGAAAGAAIGAQGEGSSSITAGTLLGGAVGTVFRGRFQSPKHRALLEEITGAGGLGGVSIVARERGARATVAQFAPTTRARRFAAVVSNIVGKPIEALEAVATVSDAGSRVAAWEAAIAAKQHLVTNGTWRPKDLRAYAAGQARGATVDFGRHAGDKNIAAFADVIPFLNAMMQGTMRYGMAWRENPARMGAMSAGVAMLSAASWALNESGENPVLLNDRASVERAAFVHMPIPGMDGALRIPMTQENGVVAAAVGYGLAQLTETDPFAAQRLKESIKRVLPSPYLPGVYEGVELWRNRTYYGDRPIESKAMEEGLPETRTTPTMRPTYTGMANVLRSTGLPFVNRASPVQVEHMVKGVVGPFADVVADLITDRIAVAGGADPAAAKPAPRPASQHPLNPFRSVWSPNNSVGRTESEGVFYDTLKEMEETASSIRQKGKGLTARPDSAQQMGRYVQEKGSGLMKDEEGNLDLRYPARQRADVREAQDLERQLLEAWRGGHVTEQFYRNELARLRTTRQAGYRAVLRQMREAGIDVPTFPEQ